MLSVRFITTNRAADFESSRGTRVFAVLSLLFIAFTFFSGASGVESPHPRTPPGLIPYAINDVGSHAGSLAPGALVATLSGPVEDQSSGLILELQTRKTEQLVGEPADLRLFLRNEGSEPVVFSESWLSVQPITLNVGDAPITCTREGMGIRGAPGASWTTLQPGARWRVKVPIFRCLCQAEPVAPCDDWLTKPGTYTLQMGIDHHPEKSSSNRSGGRPSGVWRGQLTSKAVQIRVLAPEGVDAEAWAHAKAIGESPYSGESLKRFPSSRYAALAWYSHINIEDADPSAVAALIARGRFLVTNAVPDPESPDGWASLSGADLARWRIEHAQRILQEQPRFPYTGQLRLAIAVNEVALGKTDIGRKILTDLGRSSDTIAGVWAQQFLSAAGMMVPAR